MNTKDFKIWGVRANMIGDQIMALPILTYLEKKYPNSYKYWCISKKIAQAAPLYLNHPLIDKIKITDDWEHPSGEEDRKIINSCNIKIDVMPPHQNESWFNHCNCVQETAMMAGINLDDFENSLTEDEKRPKLYKWFDTGNIDPNCIGYGTKYEKFKTKPFVAIFPFAAYGRCPNRSPSMEKWATITKDIIKKFNCDIYHFGFVSEPDICECKDKYFRFTSLSFIDQIKIALESQFAIGTDSGSMWAMGAYGHKIINLLTNHMPNHNQNFNALAPISKLAYNHFAKDDINLIKNESILQSVEAIMENKQL